MTGIAAPDVRSMPQRQGPVTSEINIALVDDHQMFLDGLGEVIRVLDPNYRCTPFGSPAEAINAIEKGDKFDLFITDLVMAEMNGIAFVMALKARSPSTPALVVSGIDTAPPIDKIMRARASGFVPKSASSAVLKDAIDAALNNDVYVSDDLWRHVETQAAPHGPIATDAPTSTEETLGARQIEVVTLMAEGCTNKEIGQILNISENTVKTHVSGLFRHLGVTRRTACVSRARALGLVS